MASTVVLEVLQIRVWSQVIAQFPWLSSLHQTCQLLILSWEWEGEMNASALETAEHTQAWFSWKRSAFLLLGGSLALVFCPFPARLWSNKTTC